eukprot:365812-Pelagomonas_calceolata.AAC.1
MRMPGICTAPMVRLAHVKNTACAQTKCSHVLTRSTNKSTGPPTLAPIHAPSSEHTRTLCRRIMRPRPHIPTTAITHGEEGYQVQVGEEVAALRTLKSGANALQFSA